MGYSILAEAKRRKKQKAQTDLACLRLFAGKNAGEVVYRSISQLHSVFNELGMPVKYDINGNMTFIHLTTQTFI
jgi:hypothetical protein